MAIRRTLPFTITRFSANTIQTLTFYFSPVVIFSSSSGLVLILLQLPVNEQAGLFLSSFLSLSFFLMLVISLLYTSSLHRNIPSKLDIIEQLSTMPSRAVYSLHLSGLCF